MMRGPASLVGQAVSGIIVTLLVILNIGSGVVSGIWLAIEGEWAVIAFGFALGFVMPMAWVVASLPSMAFLGIVGWAEQTGSRIGLGLGGFLAVIYTDLLIGGWTLFVFFTFAGRAGQGTLIPLLLWGYSTTMAPLGYMASKEPHDDDNAGTALGLLLAPLSYALLVILFFVGVERLTLVWSVIGLCVLEAIFATWLSLARMSPRSQTAPIDWREVDAGLDSCEDENQDAGEYVDEDEHQYEEERP
ncbi:MAG: hypothetical protein JXQ75_19000 [Phycisphaerae bacterium]|nr:hypothetical protein [Phycisphaerae bacterium]